VLHDLQTEMNPLTKQQEKLRGKKVQDMNSDELRIWISACDKMQNWVKYNKARRSWTESREQAIGELEKRNEE
jgi:uncharacterized protein with von Willebrand factor type A (vWA) domain